MSHYSYGAVGAYPSSANCSWPFRQIYQCPNLKTEDYSIYINTGRSRPFRAPGHVQGVFGLESLLDEAAEKIGMDPLEFRLKNYSEIDQVENIPYTSKLLKEAYLKGAEALGGRQNGKNRVQVPVKSREVSAWRPRYGGVAVDRRLMLRSSSIQIAVCRSYAVPRILGAEPIQ